MVRAYSITSEAIAAERRRVADDLYRFEPARVIQLDEMTGIPVVRIADEMPTRVKALIP